MTATELHAACRRLPLQRLAPELWLVRASGAEADARNRGLVAHLVLVRDGGRVWAVGSGPTPVIGERLRCTARQALGAAPSALVTPLAQAELTLGAAALEAPDHWAHEQVAQAMAEQCPHCVERLRQRLGSAAADLGADPVRLPNRLLQGASGSLGPFDWWAMPRAERRVALLLRHRASGVMLAPGLLWGDGPPDLRDTEVASVVGSLAALVELAGPQTRWVGHAGALLDRAAVARQAAYVQRLWQQARHAAAAGAEMPAPPPGPAHERHALNWQRAWRQAEDQWLREARR